MDSNRLSSRLFYVQADHGESHIKSVSQLRPGMVVRGLLGSTDELYVVVVPETYMDGVQVVLLVEVNEIKGWTEGNIYPDCFYPDPIHHATGLGLAAYPTGVWNQNVLIDTGDAVSDDTLVIAQLIALNHLEQDEK